MKEGMIFSIEVKREILAAVQSALKKDESLSSFVETAIRGQIRERLIQREFIARGIASLEAAHRDNEFYTCDDVMKELDDVIDAADISRRATDQ